jgi:hypothetical protein
VRRLKPLWSPWQTRVLGIAPDLATAAGRCRFAGRVTSMSGNTPAPNPSSGWAAPGNGRPLSRLLVKATAAGVLGLRWLQ